MLTWKPFKIIMDVVCEYWDVTELDLKSASRSTEFTQPRFEVCWLAKQLTNMSLPAIGRGLGGRDHTTVMNGINRVERALENEVGYADDLYELRAIAEQAMPAVPKAESHEACTITPKEIAQRIPAPGRGDLVWNRAELRELAKALLKSEASLAEHQAFADRVQSDLARLV